MLVGTRRTGSQIEHNWFSPLPVKCQIFPGTRPNSPANSGSGSGSGSSSSGGGGDGGVEKHAPSVLLMRASAPDHLLAAATLRTQLLYEYPTGSRRPNITSDGERIGISEAQSTGTGTFGAMEEAIIADMYGLRLKNEFDRDLSFRLVNAHVLTYLAICPWEHMAHRVPVPGERNSTSLLQTPPQLDSSLTTLPDGAPGGVYAAVATLDIDMAEELSHMSSRPWGRAIHRAMGVDADVPLIANGMESQHPQALSAVASGGTAYVFNLCVAPVMRRQGIARGLLSFALDDLLEQRATSSVHVHVEVCNHPAAKLYSSLGFNLVHEESLEDEEMLQRPRRCLLSFYPVS
ncbi:unnamed protein product [Closterium sp. Yama58-4]|nr:unnamed protein product [Closterium sp. Yama58-4]